MTLAARLHDRPLLLLLLAACSASSLDPEADELDELETRVAPAAIPSGSAALLQEACWGVQVVDPAVACPSPPEGWVAQGSRMFVDGSQGLAGLGLTQGDLPPALAGFCLYRWSAEGPPVAPPELSVDCPAVAPQGAGPPSLHDELRDVSRAQAGALADGTPPGLSPVTVAVVDAASSIPMSTPGIDHALGVARIIETLACTGPACAVQARQALALPLAEDGTLEDPDGGAYGVRAHVAQGIVESVLAWRQGLAAGQPPSRLVINLSLGWVTSAGGQACGTTEAEPWCDDALHADQFLAFVDPTAGTPPAYPTQGAIEAVHGALLHAACQGAVIVAAAGNADEDSCDQTPLAPGAWARLAAPTAAQCGALGFAPPPELPGWPVFTEPRPLLHAVAAVDHRDAPIALTRPGSLTTLVAPGFHAVAEPMPSAPAMRPMTGTSAATAAVSAGVALLWSHDPSQPPATVMTQLHASGTLLPRLSALPEYGPGGAIAAQPVRRLSLCAALATLDPAVTCGEPSLPLALESLEAAVMDMTHAKLPPPHATAAAGLAADSCTWCGTPVSVQLPTPLATATAEHYLFSSCAVSPNDVLPHAGPRIAGPQPDLPVCPECPLIVEAGDAVAYLSLDDHYRSMDLTGAWLRLEPEPAGDPTIIDLSAVVPLGQLQADAVVRVSLGPLPQPLAHASMGVRVEDEQEHAYVRSNELLLVAP